MSLYCNLLFRLGVTLGGMLVGVQRNIRELIFLDQWELGSSYGGLNGARIDRFCDEGYSFSCIFPPFFGIPYSSFTRWFSAKSPVRGRLEILSMAVSPAMRYVLGRKWKHYAVYSGIATASGEYTVHKGIYRILLFLHDGPSGRFIEPMFAYNQARGFLLNMVHLYF